MCHTLLGANIHRKQDSTPFWQRNNCANKREPADIASEKSEIPEKSALFYRQRSLFISLDTRPVCTHYYCILSLNESCRRACAPRLLAL